MKYLAKDFINDLKITKVSSKKFKSGSDFDPRDVAEELLLIASNVESYYNRKDAKGAIEYAKKEYFKYKMDNLTQKMKEAGPLALKQLLVYWKEEGHI
jgi:hypothetical protein